MKQIIELTRRERFAASHRLHSKQLSDEETKKICSELINSSGATSLKDMGKVMGELKKKYSDNIDFAKAGSLLKELLKS